MWKVLYQCRMLNHEKNPSQGGKKVGYLMGFRGLPTLAQTSIYTPLHYAASSQRAGGSQVRAVPGTKRAFGLESEGIASTKPRFNEGDARDALQGGGHHKSLFNEGNSSITKRSRFNGASSASKTFNDIRIQREGNTGMLMMEFSIANSLYILIRAALV